MSWKKYREYFTHNRIEEDHFVLGIDLGSAASAIAYFDPIRRNSEVLDISGGYGKASSPTALQHGPESREWIFGEYAILNANDTDALLTDFVGKLGAHEYADIGSGLMSTTEICAIYLKELVANCRSINPKAQIAGIVATMPDFIGMGGRQALAAAFKRAGLESALIKLIDEREAYLSYFLHNEQNFKGNALLLDFGGRGIRGGAYAIDGEKAECLCDDFDADLSVANVDKSVLDFFTKIYCENFNIDIDKLGGLALAQLLTFSHQHRDMIFQAGGGVRLYFNFPYPPFSRQVTAAEITGIIGPLEKQMTNFVKSLADKIPSSSRGDITVVCTGGGFEMPWVKKHISTLFPAEGLRFYKNSKTVLAEGASLLAAEGLGLLQNIGLTIVDGHKIPWDIGINVEDGGKSCFYPIIERGSHLWQKPGMAYVILQSGGREIGIYCRRDLNGEAKRVAGLAVEALPHRPIGTTKLAIKITPSTINDYIISIKDMGFGEMFPPSDAVFTDKLRIEA